MKTLSHLIFLWYIQAMNYEILSKDFTDKLLERFLRYTRQWTTSDSLMADQGIVPSTERQWEFAQLLAQELKDLGLTDVSISDHCYLCARLPATPGMEQVPPVGFLAHMDTSEEVSGENVQPQVIRNYDGNPVRLAGGAVLDPAIDTKLRRVVGDTIITSDGTTLLGSDDKAGIAIIMTGLERIIREERPHGTIEIIFSPDEETGHGMDFVPLEWLTAKQCYTFDGSTGGEIEDECFNAWKSEVVFTGKAKHTGYARPDMVNAVSMMADFLSLLPRHEAPETTDNYQGFYCPMDLSGHIEESRVTVYLRDFDAKSMENRKKAVETFAQAVVAKYRGSAVEVKHTQQYLNMKAKLDQQPHIMANLVKAVEQAGLEPVFRPIRGGTDGSRLTEMGIPCPNIFTGGHNFHSRMEWASLSQMAYGVLTLLNLVSLQADTLSK